MLYSLVQKQFSRPCTHWVEDAGDRRTDAVTGPLEHLHGGHIVGLSHLLLWATGCLAMLCVMTGSGHHPGPDVTTARLY